MYISLGIIFFYIRCTPPPLFPYASYLKTIVPGCIHTLHASSPLPLCFLPEDHQGLCPCHDGQESRAHHHHSLKCWPVWSGWTDRLLFLQVWGGGNPRIADQRTCYSKARWCPYDLRLPLLYQHWDVRRSHYQVWVGRHPIRERASLVPWLYWNLHWNEASACPNILEQNFYWLSKIKSK